MRFSELPGLLKLYILFHLPLLAAAGWISACQPAPDHAGLAAVLVFCGILLSLAKIELPVFHGRMTGAFAVVCLALLFSGVQTAVLCAAVSALIGTFVRPPERLFQVRFLRPPAYRVWFNMANCTLAGLAGALLYAPALALLPGAAGRVAGIVVFVGVHFAVNSLGVAIAMGLQQGAPPLRVWREKLLWTSPGFFATGAVVELLYLAYRYLGAYVFLLLPVGGLLFHWNRLYLDQLRHQEKESLDHAHIQELERLNSSTIAALTTAVQAKGRKTRAQVERVRELAVALANAVGLTGKELQAVAAGALLYEIGMIGVPEPLLFKAGELTLDEQRRVEEHVLIGAEIVSQVAFPYPVAEVVLSHHERWDGCGYPRGLRADEIPIGGRIVAIADAFELLTQGSTAPRALAQLRSEAGTRFDPFLVEKLAAVLEAQPRPTVPSPFSTALLPGLAEARISQTAAETTAIYDAAAAVAEQRTPFEVADRVARRALALLPIETAVLFLANGAAGNHTCAALAGKQPGLPVALGWEWDTALISADHLWLLLSPSEPGRVEVAELGGGVGWLVVVSEERAPLHADSWTVLMVLAEHAGATLQSLRRLEQSQELAETDPLTGLGNARMLRRVLEQLGSKAAGEGGEVPGFGVIVMDLDGFKAVNDTYGHLCGDEVLRQVARTIVAELRAGDVVCRYGGDEFVVVLPKVPPIDLPRVASRLKAAIGSLPPVEGNLTVGASIGTALFPQDGTDPQVVLSTADYCMYEDKARKPHRSGAARDVGNPVSPAVDRLLLSAPRTPSLTAAPNPRQEAPPPEPEESPEGLQVLHP